MNVLILKLIALTTMIIDHYGAIFHGNIMTYRMIGRLAFPIYCFLLVEGYFHSSNVKKYSKRLFIFALISEIPFDLAFYGELGFQHQNIFFTLFLGLMAIYFMENKVTKYNYSKNAVIIVACILSILLAVDYNIIGIIYILAFYFTRSYDKNKKFIIIAITMFIVNLSPSFIQQFSIVALILLYFYNGKLGPKNKFLQILFYAAYPLHLFLFWLMQI